MPIACPACGRPNSDLATRCLYCVEPLEGAAPKLMRAEPAIVVQAPVSDRYLIILAPLSDPESMDGKGPAFAQVMGWTLYDARLALQTRRHRLIRKVEGAEPAEELAARLRQLGLEPIVLAQADIESLRIASIRWLHLRTVSLDLGLAGGENVQVPYAQLLLVVRGEIARQRHHERRIATPRGASRPLTPGMCLHLYEADCALATELDAEQFDWDVLGQERSSSTPINIKRLVNEILRRAPAATLDQGFDLEPVVLSRAGSEAGLDSMLEGPESREGVIYDNQEQFRFYARWRYLVARAESSGRRGGA